MPICIHLANLRRNFIRPKNYTRAEEQSAMARTRTNEIIHVNSDSTDSRTTTPILRRSARLLAASEQKSSSKASKLSSKSTNKRKEKEDDTTGYECNICFDVAKEPVVTCCGHLYCWPCLFKWLQMHSNICPVCKGSINESSIVPIYGGGSSGSDERDEDDGLIVPPRPQGQRVESFMQQIHALRGREVLVQGIHEFLETIHSGVRANRDVSLGTSNNGEASLSLVITRTRVSGQSSLDTGNVGAPRQRRRRRE